MINKDDKLTFIHIGKCGGSTVNTTLKNNQINFNLVHIGGCYIDKYGTNGEHTLERIEFKFQSEQKYLIVIRNPVDRFVSAFYYRRHLALGLEKNRFDGEYEFFQKFATVEELIENGISILQKQYVHHIKEDIHFYLGNIINELSPENVVGVVCTETLNEDIERIFNIKVELHERKNSNRKKPIKEKDFRFLKNYLNKDYLVIEKLNNLKLLTAKQYKILSR